MTDREKVISEIEEEIRLGEHWDENSRMIDLPMLRDILALLKEQEELNDHYQSLLIAYNDMRKEQEPVGPIIEQKVFQYAKCGKCGQLLHWQGNYCHWCGQAVKWNDCI